MIRLQGVHKYFNKGRQNEIHVINDVSLDLPEKGMVAIFGKSGCGKTTLLNVIGGLDKFARGSLTVEGQDLRRDTDVIRNRYVGYIFQNYNLNKGESCFDNVADALRLCGMTDEQEIEARVTAALTNVGMEKYAKRPPDTLSGGQQQRIAIARAIVKNPPVILADEPTGNLDEANTVMIMDLLKSISRDHLVILVTHEANLVDYYCDTVIELSDGKVVNVTQNDSANGFSARDKNSIYLGELDRTDLSDQNAKVEYYGEPLSQPIRLKIVNQGGKVYVRIDTEKVQVLDQFSEVKLREGVYADKAVKSELSEGIDMSALPPVQGTRYGRLFSLKSSLKSGYLANFKDGKRGKKVLRNCMCLFAAVVVFMSAVFGTSFGDLADVDASYNHNVFYLLTPDPSVSAALSAAVNDPSTAVDAIRLATGYPRGDGKIAFRTGTFETFSPMYSSLQTNAVFLDRSLAESLKLVAGKKDDLSMSEILITTRVADALLKQSSLGYLTEYRDLVGLITTTFSLDGEYSRIAGVVRSDETAVYMSDVALAKYVFLSLSPSLTKRGADYGLTLKEGETVLVLRDYRTDVTYPKVGETIKIQGRDVTVTEIREMAQDYGEWLKTNGLEREDSTAYFTRRLREERPDLSLDSKEFSDALKQYWDLHYCEYFDYYYDQADAYLKDYYFFDPSSMEAWLYVEKDVEIAKYYFFHEEYYKAVCYKNLHGAYPSQTELAKAVPMLPYLFNDLEEYNNLYSDEFYMTDRNSAAFYNDTYLVSDADFAAFARVLGESHPTANLRFDPMFDYAKNVLIDTDLSFSERYYIVIHSSDPAVTEEWLRATFSHLISEDESVVLLTPDQIFQNSIEDNNSGIISGLITMGVLLVLMSICMYFIMRSSLMNRIKEVGIYRAIGVSKGNLIFKFFIEAVVLTTLTVFVGYLATSAFLLCCLNLSDLVLDVFYYPPWMAGVVLLILYALGLFCGTLPILSLLRKTPSEILAKYDI